jgi:hypothetical protein
MSRRIAVPTVFCLAALALPAGAMASSRDGNGDGLPDRWEKAHHLSLSVNQSTRDQDHDGLNNLGELHHKSNPRKADTDRDGLKDGAEVKTGNNPRKRDSDGDGIRDDRENAGTVASFVNGVLTLKLANGQTISGAVSSATETECEDEDENEIEDETPVHNQRRRGAAARAARNGETSGSSADVAQADQGGRHNGDGAENESENENEHGAENENEAGRHNSAGCASAPMAAGTMVHEATLVNGTFTKVELVS